MTMIKLNSNTCYNNNNNNHNRRTSNNNSNNNNYLSLLFIYSLFLLFLFNNNTLNSFEIISTNTNLTTFNDEKENLTTTTTIATSSSSNNSKNEAYNSYTSDNVIDNDNSIVTGNYSNISKEMAEATTETLLLPNLTMDVEFNNNSYNNNYSLSNLTLISRRTHNHHHQQHTITDNITNTNNQKLSNLNSIKFINNEKRQPLPQPSPQPHTVSRNLNRFSKSLVDLEPMANLNKNNSNGVSSISTGASLQSNQQDDDHNDNGDSQISFIEFDFQINEFLQFEHKDALIDLNAKLKYKWWTKNNEYNNNQNNNDNENTQKSSTSTSDSTSSRSSSSSNMEYDEDMPSLKATDHQNSRSKAYTKSSNAAYPFIDFKDKSVKFRIQNHLFQIDNVEEYYEKYEDKDATKPKAQKLYSGEVNEETEEEPLSVRKLKRQYSYLEQNVTIKFKCNNHRKESTTVVGESQIVDDKDDQLDFSNFPFDVHRCVLEFDLIANQNYFSSLMNNNHKHNKHGGGTGNDNDEKIVYVFSPSKHYSQTSQQDYFKLVKTENNGSLVSKEWILKHALIKYFNATSASNNIPDPQSNNATTTTTPSSFNDDGNNLNEDSESISDYIMFLSSSASSNNGGQHITKRSNENQKQQTTPTKTNSQSSNPAKVSIEFLIYRRREPQIYLFVVPLIILTLITFLIFFLPTTSTDEKSLIALLNCAFLLAYNVYAFKLVVLTYEMIRIPIILKYSNCLMIIQLAVLAYTCLVKSIYHNGFLTFSSRTYMDTTEELYNQLVCANQPHQHPLHTYQYNNDCSDHEKESGGHGGHNTCVIRRACTKLTANEEVDSSLKYTMQDSENINIHEQIESFGAQLNHTTGTGTGTGGTTDESNYTVYNNIDQVCECNGMETDADCVNGTQETFGIEEEDNANASSTVKNDYGEVVEVVDESNNSNSNSNKASQQQQQAHVKGSQWLFEKICCINPQDSTMIEHNSKSDGHKPSLCKTATTAIVAAATTECDYTSHLSRRNMSNINKNGKQQHQYPPPPPPMPTDFQNRNGSRNLSFVIKSNRGVSGNTLLNGNKLIDHNTLLFSAINSNLKQLIKFEEATIKEKLVKEEWKRKARFCDGICCLFIFFILITCSICIFAILPTLKISSMVD